MSRAWILAVILQFSMPDVVKMNKYGKQKNAFYIFALCITLFALYIIIIITQQHISLALRFMPRYSPRTL